MIIIIKQGWRGYTMTNGDFFGESLLFECKSITDYGRIIAKSDTVECLLLRKEDFPKINSLDVEIFFKKQK